MYYNNTIDIPQNTRKLNAKSQPVTVTISCFLLTKRLVSSEILCVEYSSVHTWSYCREAELAKTKVSGQYWDLQYSQPQTSQLEISAAKRNRKCICPLSIFTADGTIMHRVPKLAFS